jgi:endonuclease/exonuclease/phosphatase family metal-dependent hydrolase
MSFNIRYGTADDGLDRWELRRPRVIETIRRHDPDILCLQEALDFQIEEICAAVPKYEFFGVGRDDGKSAGEHAAVLFDNRRFERTEGGTFWFSDSPDEVCSRSWGNSLCRICTWIRMVERKTGRRLVVYNVHLDHISATSRRKSVELLLDVIANQETTDRIIVTGDFNAGESTAEIGAMGATEISIRLTSGPARRRFVDTFRVSHPSADRAGTFNGRVGNAAGPKIDYVFILKGALRVVSADIARDQFEGRYPSDHFPVWARLGWPDELTRPRADGY